MKLTHRALCLTTMILWGPLAAATLPAQGEAPQQEEPGPADVAGGRRFLAMFRGGDGMRTVSESDVVDSALFRADYLADLVFDLTNEERARHGLQRVSRSTALDRVATAHSTDMAARNYFSHTTKGVLRRANLGDRMRGAGVQFTRATENIAMHPVVVQKMYEIWNVGLTSRRREIGRRGITYGDMAAKVMDGWMNSPGHRQNILDANVTELGVGCAVGDRKECPYVYVTQNFRR